MAGFAKLDHDLSYWQKQHKPLFPDLVWNIPEQKTGRVSVIGGNAQSFSNVIRTAEYLSQSFPVKQVTAVLPETLRSKLPTSENISFTAATTTGTFAKSYALEQAIGAMDYTLLIGDLSRNAETAIALTNVIKATSKPVLITRDAVDLLAADADKLLSREGLIIFGSMLQLQKVFRAVYYPRMIMLSQPLLPIIETLHKFTLTYPATLITFHQDQVIVASDGKISTTKLDETEFSPITLWSGRLAARITALNLFNPSKPFESSTAAILYK